MLGNFPPRKHPEKTSLGKRDDCNCPWQQWSPQMIKPIFSFTYDGRRFQPTGEGNFWKIDDMLTVSLEAVEYKEFNAVHWLLNFENTGSVNSGILSDIWDCDISLPIPFKPPLRPGYISIKP